jgi:hypothetical protein
MEALAKIADQITPVCVSRAIHQSLYPLVLCVRISVLDWIIPTGLTNSIDSE